MHGFIAYMLAMSSVQSPSNQSSLFAYLCAISVCTMMSYGICGSAIQSMFLAEQGSGMLPAVWLIVALASALVVTNLHRATARIAILPLLLYCNITAISLLVVLLACAHAHVPFASFGLYVWKDVYIVVLVDLFWTFTNLHFTTSRAARQYGLFAASGCIGNVLGTLLLQYTLQQTDTLQSLWATLVPLVAMALICAKLQQQRRDTLPKHVPTKSLFAGFSVVRKSHYLVLMLFVVMCVQGIINIVDFQFNHTLETMYPEIDHRTRAISWVYALINIVSLLLQVGVTPLLPKLGLPLVLIGVPCLLMLTGSAVLLMPNLVTMLTTKILGKCFDYSIFNISKEMLYLPLDYAEKTQGKAMIDILTYRMTKGLVSLLLLLLAGFATTRLLSMINMILYAIWVILACVIVRRYRLLTQHNKTG